MFHNPPGPVFPITFSTRIWLSTAWLIGSFILFTAAPCLALEPATENEVAGIDLSDPSTDLQSAGDQERDAAMLRATASKLSARTMRTVDVIVEGKALRLMEQLSRLNDETSMVSETISHRVDARLGEAVSKLRDNTYTSAPAPALSQSQKPHTPL